MHEEKIRKGKLGAEEERLKEEAEYWLLETSFMEVQNLGCIRLKK